MTLFPVVIATPARPGSRLDLDEVARIGCVHPEFVRRLASLGLLDVTVEADRHLTFPPGAPARLARIQRLHVGLSLSYAAIGLVMELLDRIDDLEHRLRTRPVLDSEGTRPWI
jgi:chaperone modulatory protein CbpM